MNNDDGPLGRWIGPFLGAALLIGACGSDHVDPEAANLDETDTLALADQADQADGAPAVSVIGEVDPEDPMVDPGPPAFETDRLDDVEGLPGVAITAEAFEQMRSDERERAVVLAEMEAQGLSADEAVCFLDNISADLFITFGSSEMPAEDQFAELMELLVLCDVSLVAGS